jgi:hypothetical protein
LFPLCHPAWDGGKLTTTAALIEIISSASMHFQPSSTAQMTAHAPSLCAAHTHALVKKNYGGPPPLLLLLHLLWFLRSRDFGSQYIHCYYNALWFIL